MVADFLIIGGGVVGLASAHALLKAGYSVTLVERGEIGREASWAGGGILSPLCPWDYKEPVTDLALRSMRSFEEFTLKLHETTAIDPEYHRSGMLILPPNQPEIARQWCKNNQLALQEVQLVDYLPNGEGRGLLLPEIAQVRNPRLISAFHSSVKSLGGVILEHCDVTKLNMRGNRVDGLQSSRGELCAGSFIVAAGAWSKSLLADKALGMDIRPIRGQILLFKFDKPPFGNILLKDNLYMIPRRDGHVLVGSTLEDVGFDKSITLSARQDLLGRIRGIFPGWRGVEPLKHWAGFRPGSPDNIPTIGRHRHITNLYANSGHFRYGVTMSLASAELLVNEIEGNRQPIPVEQYLWR